MNLTRLVIACLCLAVLAVLAVPARAVNYDVDFDSIIAVNFPPQQGFLFDAKTGERLNVSLAEGRTS